MNNQEQIWKEVPNHENYEISNEGKIRRRSNEKELKLRPADNRGYSVITLFTDKKKYTKKVARLVWEAFNGCPCKLTVDHIDRNPSNNNINNLRCITLQENLKNRNIYKEKNKYNLTTEDKMNIVRDYRLKLETTWTLSNKLGIPINYLQTVFKRGSWDKLWIKKNTKNIKK